MTDAERIEQLQRENRQLKGMLAYVLSIIRATAVYAAMTTSDLDQLIVKLDNASREQQIAELRRPPPPADPDDPDECMAWCPTCGEEMQHVRPGKWQRQCDCEEAH